VSGWNGLVETLVGFFELGGNVLYAIFAVTLLMWTLIGERMIYMAAIARRDAAAAVQRLAHRRDPSSWYGKQAVRREISIMRQRLRGSLPIIQTLVALCPLLGLLGTVSGMIEVFDVMAVAGNGNPRAMASGVSQATIPTMAGMVAALSGLYLSARLCRQANARSHEFAAQVERQQ
jgi:biopolymer transport protein ExbB